MAMEDARLMDSPEDASAIICAPNHSPDLPNFCAQMSIERSWSCRSSSSSDHIIGPAGDPNSMTYPELWLWRAHLGPNMLFGLPLERNAAGAELELQVQLQL